MTVDRCVCFDVPIADLKLIADKHGCKTVEELQDYIDFGFGCGMCIEYVERMLETGETEFDPF